MSLDMEEPEQEQNEMKDLQVQLEETNSLVKHLSTQLSELRDKVWMGTGQVYDRICILLNTCSPLLHCIFNDIHNNIDVLWNTI